MGEEGEGVKVSGRCLRTALATIAALLAGAVCASVAAASTAYVIDQRQANSLSTLTLAPSGLRFEFSVPVRRGGKRRSRHVRPLLGLIIRYGDATLFLLDPVHHTYQQLSLKSAISSYEAEQRVLARAQPSVKLPPAPGTRPTSSGQASLVPPTARLRRLGLTARIGPVIARAYQLQQGTVRERLWYSNALPQPPAAIQSLLAKALGSSASGPLGRALRAHAAQIPLRIDERSGRRWLKVLRTLSIRQTTLGPRTLTVPRGYRKASLLPTVPGGKGPRARPADTPGAPVRCGLLLITGPLGCTSTGAELTGLAGPVSEHPAIWAFYWGSGWASHLDYVGAINHGLENMVGDQFADPNSSDYYGPLGQYGVHRGQFLGYTVVNDNPDASIGSWNYFDIAWFVLSHRWGSDAPHYWWRWSSQDPIFAIFVDGSKVDKSGWDGYHAFAVTEGVFFAFLVHPAMPYLIVKVPPIDSLTHSRDTYEFKSAVDTATELASHEFVEAATDPYPFTSWADPLKQPIWEQGEIADICAEGSSYPSGKATRVVQYGSALTPYWSNDDQSCMPNARPSAQIALPTNGETHSWLTPVTLAVRNSDPFDNGPVDCTHPRFAGCGVRWDDDKDGQGIAHGAIATISSLSIGTHHISATVTDSQGGVTVAGPVTVNVVAQPPRVHIDSPATGSTFGSDETINFRGSAFDPQQGDVAGAATWSVDGTQVGTGAAFFQYRIPTQGTHTVTLSYTNSADNLSSSDSVTLNIGPPTGNPSVMITSPADNSAFAAGDQITFSATATPQGSATVADSGYSWKDDVDGPLGTGKTITHTLSGSSCEIIIHHVTVTATDSLGHSGSDTITVQDGSIC